MINERAEETTHGSEEKTTIKGIIGLISEAFIPIRFLLRDISVLK